MTATARKTLQEQLMPLTLRGQADLDALAPDNTKTGMFILHRCWRCDDGNMPCVQGYHQALET